MQFLFLNVTVEFFSKNKKYIDFNTINFIWFCSIYFCVLHIRVDTSSLLALRFAIECRVVPLALWLLVKLAAVASRCLCATSQIINMGERHGLYECVFTFFVVFFLSRRRCASNVWTLQKSSALASMRFYSNIYLLLFISKTWIIIYFFLFRVEKNCLINFSFNRLVEYLLKNWFNFARCLEFYTKFFYLVYLVQMNYEIIFSLFSLQLI